MTAARALSIVLTALLMLGASAASGQTRLVWSHALDAADPAARWSTWAADEIRRRSAGRIEVQVAPAPAPAGDRELGQALQLGTVDVIVASAAFLARATPRVGVGAYPYLFRDADHVITFGRSPVFRDLADAVRAASGVQWTAVSYQGTHHVASVRAFSRCDDLTGLRLRAPDGPAAAALVRACAATAVAAPPDAPADALRAGRYDAVEGTLAAFEAQRLADVRPHLVLTGHAVDTLVTQVGAPAWNRLAEADRRLLADVMAEAAAGASRDARQRENERLDALRRKGMRIVEVDPAAFRERVLQAADPATMGYDRRDLDRVLGLLK